jgi:integrase
MRSVGTERGAMATFSRTWDVCPPIPERLDVSVSVRLEPRSVARVPGDRFGEVDRPAQRDVDAQLVDFPHQARDYLVRDAACRGCSDRYRALVLLAAHEALRWSELVALRVDRLSPSRDHVRVDEKIVESGRLIRGEPKTKRSRRWVTVPDFVALALAEHVKKYPPGPDGLVFTAPQGGPIGRPDSSGPRRLWRPESKASPSATSATPGQHSRFKKGRTRSWWRFAWDMRQQR